MLHFEVASGAPDEYTCGVCVLEINKTNKGSVFLSDCCKFLFVEVIGAIYAANCQLLKGCMLLLAKNSSTCVRG